MSLLFSLALAATPSTHRAHQRTIAPALSLALDAPVGDGCDLCAREFAVILATGRSGSTSLLETLNSLPGVSLRGENHASLWASYDMYRRAIYGGPNESNVPAYEHGSLSTRQLLCELQDFFVAFDPAGAHAEGQRIVLHGFKELVLPSRVANMGNATGDRSQGPLHLDGDNADDWMDFLLTLFPCARIIFSYRRDTVAQANSTFFLRENISSSWLDGMNSAMRGWHERVSGTTASSYLLPLEEFSAAEATRLARWLGFDGCTFHSLAHANDADEFDDTAVDAGTPGHTGKFHQDYEHVNLTCSTRALDNPRIPSHRPVRFYLHEDLGAPFRHVQSHVRKLMNQKPLDRHVAVTIAEHFTDLYAFRPNPLPTRNIATNTPKAHRVFFRCAGICWMRFDGIPYGRTT